MNLALNYSAIYVLKNLTNDRYYVGQAVNGFKRVNQHFSGKANGNIYADLNMVKIFKSASFLLKKSNKMKLNIVLLKY